MCLIPKKNQEFKRSVKAKSDIVVYKVLEIHYFTGGDFNNTERVPKLLTPFRYQEITIGETYESNLIKNKYSGYIEKGLHSMADIEGAKDLIRAIDGRMISFKVCKCVIPAGSNYYCGIFRDHISYASTKLKYIEAISL